MKTFKERINYGKGYRKLRVDEVLQKGDQFWCGDRWSDTVDIGLTAKEMIYRRHKASLYGK
jgi:hypothetical protein